VGFVLVILNVRSIFMQKVERTYKRLPKMESDAPKFAPHR